MKRSELFLTWLWLSFGASIASIIFSRDWHEGFSASYWMAAAIIWIGYRQRAKS